jgi:SNF2 family DNA or RNA helicase
MPHLPTLPPSPPLPPLPLPQHVYGSELTETDPSTETPENITVTLKPHQLTALQKCFWMETQRTLHYDIPDIKPYLYNHRLPSRDVIMQGRFEISTNVGIIGDIVGYGKTLIALAVIAKVPPNDIVHESSRMFCSHGSHSAYFRGISEDAALLSYPLDTFFHTTLVIVPRGPVYIQWKNAIKQQTTLNALFIDNMYFVKGNMPGVSTTHANFKTYIERYNIVLIKSTTFKTMWDYYHPSIASPHHRDTDLFIGWDRIFIDEAHDELSKVPSMRYKFLWLITSTHEMLLNHFFNCSRYISHSLKDCLDEERMLYMLVKSKPSFVRQSFDLPKINEYYYICKLSNALIAIQSFISPAIMAKIHANDIVGAIRDLGGTDEQEHTIVELVCKEIENNIQDKNTEIRFVQSLQTITSDHRDARILILTNEIARLESKLKSLKERIQQIHQETCSICLSPYDNPILLKCTHLFCGTCIIHYLHTNKDAKVCPMCRDPIDASKLIAIVKSSASSSSSHMPSSFSPSPSSSSSSQMSQTPSSIHTTLMEERGKFTKEEVLMKLIHHRPEGKFLVFSKLDASFVKIIQQLNQHNIPFAEIKGSTGQMMNMLERFKMGFVKVILLNTHNAGSGIDISYATDVILFHQMGQERTQAIGRAQRVGRTIPLNVHHLLYPSECL